MPSKLYKALVDITNLIHVSLEHGKDLALLGGSMGRTFCVLQHWQRHHAYGRIVV